MSHQDRREPLPKGYQFGDARKSMPLPVSEYERRYDAAKVQIGDTIRVRVPKALVFDPLMFSSSWPPRTEDGWNVIEGEKD